VGSDRTACDSQLVEYQRGVTKQIEEKNEQIGDLQSTLKQMQKLTLFRAVEAKRQKWEARETRLISQLDEALEQIATLQKTHVFLHVKELLQSSNRHKQLHLG